MLKNIFMKQYKLWRKLKYMKEYFGLHIQRLNCRCYFYFNKNWRENKKINTNVKSLKPCRCFLLFLFIIHQLSAKQFQNQFIPLLDNKNTKPEAFVAFLITLLPRNLLFNIYSHHKPSL
jgi:hypothetical protein